MTSYLPALQNKKRTLFQQIFSRSIVFVFLGLLVCIASVLVLVLVNLHTPSPLPDTSRPSRSLTPSSQTQVLPTQKPAIPEAHVAWVSPTRGQAVHDIVRLKAAVSPTKSDTFKVDHIIFTAWWAGVDPHSWRNICSVSSPTRDNTFQCDGNLRQLQAPTGTLMVSFDMYDSYGHVKLAPAGGFAITYSSLSATHYHSNDRNTLYS